MKNFQKLSFHFEPELLRKDLEIIQVNWINHFNERDYEGTWTGIPLRVPKSGTHPLSTGGEQSVYENTELLDTLEYMPQVLAEFKCPLTSVRLLKLAPLSRIKKHKDVDLSFWYGNARLHVPIMTNDEVEFMLEDTHMPMRPGECWFAEFSKIHSVYNGGLTDRIHLVIDCEVDDWLRELFVREGIIEQDEQEPSEMERHDDVTKLQIVASLEAQGTETSLRLAREIKEAMHNSA